MKTIGRANSSIQTLDREIRGHHLESLGEPERTLTGTLARVVTVFNVIRPLLLVFAQLPIVPKASRTAVTVFVQSIEALSAFAVPASPDDVADFKAGRDL